MVLTDLGIRKLPIPSSGQKLYFDKGLGIRVSQGGTKTFVAKIHGKRVVLGRYPDISLKMARQAFHELKANKTPQRRLSSLSEALSAYLSECEAKNRPATVKQYRHFLSQVAKPSLVDIQRSDIDLSSPHAVMAWRVFFNWCIRNDLVDRNPFAHTPVRWNTRTRLLTDDEVTALWQYDFAPYSDYVKLSILTGQRIGQWANFTVEGDTIIFPAGVMKNKQEHVIPATPWALSILGDLRPFNGWSRAKARIDKHVPMPHWTLHDCRRYFSTCMASLQIPLHVTEFILSHKGEVSGVAAVYNRYNFLNEMRTALAAYEDRLVKVVDFA